MKTYLYSMAIVTAIDKYNWNEGTSISNPHGIGSFEDMICDVSNAFEQFDVNKLIQITFLIKDTVTEEGISINPNLKSMADCPIQEVLDFIIKEARDNTDRLQMKI